jgi:hypothetical protein
MFTKIDFNEDIIIIKKYVFKEIIKYSDVKQLIIEKPKYHGIPGSGFSYYYHFNIKTNNISRNKRFSLVFNYNENEYSDLIEYLSKKNIDIIEKEYDNSPDLSD